MLLPKLFPGWEAELGAIPVGNIGGIVSRSPTIGCLTGLPPSLLTCSLTFGVASRPPMRHLHGYHALRHAFRELPRLPFRGLEPLAQKPGSFNHIESLPGPYKRAAGLRLGTPITGGSVREVHPATGCIPAGPTRNRLQRSGISLGGECERGTNNSRPRPIRRGPFGWHRPS